MYYFNITRGVRAAIKMIENASDKNKDLKKSDMMTKTIIFMNFGIFNTKLNSIF